MLPYLPSTTGTSSRASVDSNDASWRSATVASSRETDPLCVVHRQGSYGPSYSTGKPSYAGAKFSEGTGASSPAVNSAFSSPTPSSVSVEEQWDKLLDNCRETLDQTPDISINAAANFAHNLMDASLASLEQRLKILGESEAQSWQQCRSPEVPAAMENDENMCLQDPNVQTSPKYAWETQLLPRDPHKAKAPMHPAPIPSHLRSPPGPSPRPSPRRSPRSMVHSEDMQVCGMETSSIGHSSLKSKPGTWHSQTMKRSPLGMSAGSHGSHASSVGPDSWEGAGSRTEAGPPSCGRKLEGEMLKNDSDALLTSEPTLRGRTPNVESSNNEEDVAPRFKQPFVSLHHLRPPTPPRITLNFAPDLQGWKRLAERMLGYVPIKLWLGCAVGVGAHQWDGLTGLLILQALAVVGWWCAESMAQSAEHQAHVHFSPMLVVKRDDGAVHAILASDLRCGDWCQLFPNSMVHADMMLGKVSGDILTVDQSILTGNQAPVKLGSGDVVPQGAVVISGEAEGVTLRTHVANTSDAWQLQVSQWTDRLFMMTTIVVVVAELGHLDGGVNWGEMLMSFVVFTVAFSPLFVPMVVRVAMAQACQHLRERLQVATMPTGLSSILQTDVLCMDPAEDSELTVVEHSMEEPGAGPISFLQIVSSADDLLLHFALANDFTGTMSWDGKSLDCMILESLSEAGKERLDTYTQNYSPRVHHLPDLPDGHFTEVSICNSDGASFNIIRGDPKTVLTISGTEKAIGDDVFTEVAAINKRGLNTIAVARRQVSVEEDTWTFVGLLAFSNERVKPSVLEALEGLSDLGVDVKLLVANEPKRTADMCSLLFLGSNVVALNSASGQGAAFLLEEADGISMTGGWTKTMVVDLLQQRGLKVAVLGGHSEDGKLSRVGCGLIAVHDAMEGMENVAMAKLRTPDTLGSYLNVVRETHALLRRLVAYIVARATSTAHLLFFFTAAWTLGTKNETLVLEPYSSPSLHINISYTQIAMLVVLVEAVAFMRVCLPSTMVRHARPQSFPSAGGMALVVAGLSGIQVASSLISMAYWLSLSEIGGSMKRPEVASAIYLQVCVSQLVTICSNISPTACRVLLRLPQQASLAGCSPCSTETLSMLTLGVAAGLAVTFTVHFGVPTLFPLPISHCLAVWLVCAVEYLLQISFLMYVNVHGGAPHEAATPRSHRRRLGATKWHTSELECIALNECSSSLPSPVTNEMQRWLLDAEQKTPAQQVPPLQHSETAWSDTPSQIKTTASIWAAYSANGSMYDWAGTPPDAVNIRVQRARGERLRREALGIDPRTPISSTKTCAMSPPTSRRTTPTGSGGNRAGSPSVGVEIGSAAMPSSDSYEPSYLHQWTPFLADPSPISRALFLPGAQQEEHSASVTASSAANLNQNPWLLSAQYLFASITPSRFKEQPAPQASSSAMRRREIEKFLDFGSLVDDVEVLAVDDAPDSLAEAQPPAAPTNEPTQSFFDDPTLPLLRKSSSPTPLVHPRQQAYRYLPR